MSRNFFESYRSHMLVVVVPGVGRAIEANDEAPKTRMFGPLSSPHQRGNNIHQLDFFYPSLLPTPFWSDPAQGFNPFGVVPFPLNFVTQASISRHYIHQLCPHELLISEEKRDTHLMRIFLFILHIVQYHTISIGPGYLDKYWTRTTASREPKGSTMVSIAPSYTDVLIIGAGPAGLMAAQALSCLGVQVKIVDRRGPTEQYGNADGLTSRTLEIWQSYGLLNQFSLKACPIHMMVGYEEGSDGIVRSSPCTNVVVPARYQYDLTASPEIIEGVLRESMSEVDLQIAHRLTPISIDLCDASHVKVVLQRVPACSNGDPTSISSEENNNNSGVLEENLAHTETVFARYVIGADGARSWVRRHLNIPMEGDHTEYFWGAADVLVNTNFPDFRSKCIIQANTGAIIIIPREEDKIRVYVQFSTHEAARKGDGRLDRHVSFELACRMIFDKVKDGLKPYTIEFPRVFWCTIFTVSQMVAAKYSVDNRIFIAGDACHTHSPKAGQGANAAIGDAHNLAWKIAHVLRKWANPTLLHTYETERRSYAQDLIAFDKIIAESLDGGTAAQYQSLVHERNMFTSGIGIKYQSSLTRDVGLPKGATHIEAGYRLAPAAVERLADWRPMDLQDLAPSDGLFKIFLFPGDILCDLDAKRLEEFCNTLWSSPHIANLLGTRVRLYAILNSAKEMALWTDVPSHIRDWKQVFVAKTLPSENVYVKLGISVEGAVALVRPDGYVALASILYPSSAQEIASFFSDLK
ncbi:FAD binding domain-containing protein [Mycena sp. CBHHK59/15]|nr:FAD binding domain-containing protein [Mycena sp. CBHHK59/15]